MKIFKKYVYGGMKSPCMKYEERIMAKKVKINGKIVKELGYFECQERKTAEY